jgi:LacI family transcriptional regulator
MSKSKYNPNGEKVSIRDVARAAGVAIGTVSRVLHDNVSVSSNVRERVLDAIRQLKYEPNKIAQSMRLGVTHTVACVTRDISISGFGTIVNAAEDVLRSRGYTLLLAITDERKEREIEVVRVLTQHRVDGIIMTTSSEEDIELADMIRNLRIPVVLLDRDIPRELDAVTIDHRRGTAAATEYLLRLGHDNIALLTGRPSMRPARERIAGFEAAYAAVGRQPNPSQIRVGGFSADYGFREASALLSSSSRPTAFIAGGMSMLPGLLRAINSNGLKIPDDISVIAGADSDLALLMAPAVTAVRWSGSEEGRFAVELLLSRLEGHKGDPKRVMLDTELVIRGSCAPTTKRRK